MVELVERMKAGKVTLIDVRPKEEYELMHIPGANSVPLDELEKLRKSIEQAIDAAKLQDGMTISFHHHFRNSDHVLSQVVEAIAKKGTGNLTLTLSFLKDVNNGAAGLRFGRQAGISARRRRSGGSDRVSRRKYH